MKIKNNKKNMKVLCVLVLYNPSFDILLEAIESITQQVDLLWISDNTPDGYDGIDSIISTYSDRVKYALMDGNVGIAKAQNEGIRYAINNNFDFVYFLDQDSISPERIVDNLLLKFQELEKEGFKVGGVGPQPFNRETGKEYRASVKKGHYIKEGIKEVTELINSASLIRVDLFRSIGMMDESLFIDGVDHELCWRAHHLEKYRFFMITSLLLSHKLGEGDQHFMGITVKIPTPFRTYYQFRNYFYLIRRNYVPIYWKVSNGIKYLGKYFYYPLFCKQKGRYFTNINRGIIDGIFHKNSRNDLRHYL